MRYKCTKKCSFQPQMFPYPKLSPKAVGVFSHHHLSSEVSGMAFDRRLPLAQSRYNELIRGSSRHDGGKYLAYSKRCLFLKRYQHAKIEIAAKTPGTIINSGGAG